MATDTTPAPTDADLRTMAEGSALMLRDSYTTNWFATEPGLLAFARAVLAKWGAQPAASPAPVVAWMRRDGMKAMPADEKEGWLSSGHGDIVEDYTVPLCFANIGITSKEGDTKC